MQAIVPASIADWRNLAFSDPGSAAALLYERCADVLQRTGSSVLAALPTQEQLRDAFASSAAASLEARPSGETSPLSGVPYLLKDVFDVPGYRTMASSTFLDDVRGMPKDASPVFERMSAKLGAVFAGKTQMHEFAYGLSGANPHYGHCIHPHHSDRLAGGSSSGSARAVAEGIVPIAFGTDTGGSIRVPASYCGIFGFRCYPHYLTAPGCFPLAESFDTIGWFTQNAPDMVTMLEAWEGCEGHKPAADGSVGRGGSLRGCRLHTSHDTIAEDALARLPFDLENLRTSMYEEATRDSAHHFSVLQSLEALAVHEAWLETYRNAYDPGVWARIERARYWKVDDIRRAECHRDAVATLFADLLERYDFLVMPAVPAPAPLVNDDDPETRLACLSLTTPVSLAGLPALAVPFAIDDGLSAGLQFVVRRDDYDTPAAILRALAADKFVS